jgi:hypothetical protein
VASGSPLRSPPVLHVGLIGHRQLPDADLSRLQKAACLLLARIRDAAVGALARDQRGGIAVLSAAPLQLRCVSRLSEGADCLLAEAALTLGYALLAPLPFSRDIYAEDFTSSESKAAYRGLLARADAVYEMNGMPRHAEAYRAAGQLLLEQTDILVAVWDGTSEHGVDTTAQVVREALARGLPVAVIAAAAPHDVRELEQATDDIEDHTLEARVARLLVPPGVSRHIQRDIQAYYAETPGDARWAARLAAGLENVLLLGTAREEPAPPQPPPEVVVPGAHAPVVASVLKRVDAVIPPHFATADRLAIRYGALYRASSALRYLAVLPATLGLLLAFYAPPLLSRLGFMTQLVVLAGTLVLFWIDRRAGWHRRFLDYRYLAEHLRHTRLLALFGSTEALPRLPPHQATAASDWVNWHLRSVVRSLGLVSARVDPAYTREAGDMLRREVADQVHFYATRARRFAALSMRLRAAGAALFMLGLVLTAVRVGMAILGVAGSLYQLSAELALVVPALAPICFGLESQNEYSRLSQRFGAMVRQLRRTLNGLSSHRENHTQIERIARDAVSVMLAEVSDWRILIKVRDLSPY